MELIALALAGTAMLVILLAPVVVAFSVLVIIDAVSYLRVGGDHRQGRKP